MVLRAARLAMRLVDNIQPVLSHDVPSPRVFSLPTGSSLSQPSATPPVGLCLVLGMAISGLPMEKLMKPLVPFLGAIIAVLLLMAFEGETVLFIPRLLGFVK